MDLTLLIEAKRDSGPGFELLLDSLSISDETMEAILNWTSKWRPYHHRIGISKIVANAITLLLSATSLLMEKVPELVELQRNGLVKKIFQHYRRLHKAMAVLVDVHRELCEIEPFEGTTIEAAACLLSLHMHRRFIIKYQMPGYMRFLKHLKDTGTSREFT